MVNHVELDRSFQALAHPVRRAIVARLAGGPASVAEAGRGSRASKPAITKHLRVLEAAGIVHRDVRGRTHVLTLQQHRLAAAGEWITDLRALWERKLDVVAAYLDEQEKPR